MSVTPTMEVVTRIVWTVKDLFLAAVVQGSLSHQMGELVQVRYSTVIVYIRFSYDGGGASSS